MHSLKLSARFYLTKQLFFKETLIPFSMRSFKCPNSLLTRAILSLMAASSSSRVEAVFLINEFRWR